LFEQEISDGGEDFRRYRQKPAEPIVEAITRHIEAAGQGLRAADDFDCAL
jgi:predicted secreted Zn-dependent protease